MSEAFNQDSPSVPPLTQLREEERLFRKTVRQFAQEKIGPLVAEMDRNQEIPRALLEQLFRLGLMGIQTPAKYGGAGGSFFMTVLAIEEIARVDPAVSVCVDVQNVLLNSALLQWASDEQKGRYIPALTRDTVGAYALSEPGCGSDAFSMSTRARRDGDGYVLSGRKAWITNGAEAGLFLVFANAAPEAGFKGITAFLVERDAPGLSCGPNEEKLGIRASSTCELVLDGVRVERRNVLGDEGEGYDIAIQTLNRGRIGIGAQMVGLAQGAMDEALSYAQERKQFGQAIAKFQGVHFPLARMATEIDAARLLVYNAARSEESGLFFLDLLRPAAAAKYFASQVAERAASEALEIFGGNGYSKAFPVEKFYRDAKIGKIYEGTCNMQLRTIAGTLLGRLD